MDTRERAERARRAVAQYAGGLVRLAFAYLRNLQDAEDAAQDALLAYLRAAPAFRDDEHEKAWLIRVTINRCKNQLKSAWFRGRRPLPADLPGPTEEEGELIRAVMALDEKYRLPIHLHYYEGYAIAEIARLLGAKPATIGTRLARGRALLRERMGGEIDG
ncbi:MAG: sigma-70 family RNA polymerase sigma factor [Clostridiales bacterium]|nr:sigma-70 family RNA polymerase sigma factor [Clostridiales bacterium]